MIKSDCCVICQSKALSSAPAVVTPFIAERVYGRETFPTRLLTCRDCGMGFYELRYSDDEMAKLYSGYRDEAYLRQRNKFEPWYTARLNSSLFQDPQMLKRRQQALVDLVDAYDPGLSSRAKAVLDYGGDDGKLVYQQFENAKKYVFDISGVDVKPGLLHAAPASEVRYDLVICSNVLEHTPYPHETLEQITAYCHEGTVVYLEVPYERPYSFDTLKKRIAQQMLLLAMRPRLFTATFGTGMFTHLHEHVNYYSKQAVQKLFARQGFKDISVFIEVQNGYPYVCGFARK